MATHYQIIKEMQLSELSWDDTVLKVDDFARLIPTDEFGEYSQSIFGQYRDTAILTFPNFILEALTELWSFEILKAFRQDEDDEDLGTVVAQVSNDNGVTWLYWDGAAWSTAGANDWNTEETIQGNISTFAFVAGSVKQLRFRVKLSPDPLAYSTPAVFGVAFHYELAYTPEEDVVRSLVSRLETDVIVSTEVAITIGTSKNTFILPIGVEIDSVVGVWNVTADPGKLTSIYSSISSVLDSETETGEKVYIHTVTLTGAQAINSQLFAKINVKIPFYIAPDSDYVLSTIPKFIIELGDHEEDTEFRNDGNKFEKNISKLKVRIRKHAKAYRMPIAILSYTPMEDLSLQMNRKLIRVLKQAQIISLATADRMQISNESEFGSSNVIREDLSVKSFEFDILYKDLEVDYEEVDLVETFETTRDYGGA